jgi:WD40 repeat protein
MDQYIALWNCQKKILLSKIEIPNQFLKCVSINMNGETFMYSTSGSFKVSVYSHSLGKKSVEKTLTLEKHTGQVTALDISYDGLMGVTGGQDRTIYVWDLLRGEAIRSIQVPSFVQKT